MWRGEKSLELSAGNMDGCPDQKDSNATHGTNEDGSRELMDSLSIPLHASKRKREGNRVRWLNASVHNVDIATSKSILDSTMNSTLYG